jgi:hypothetical protein
VHQNRSTAATKCNPEEKSEAQVSSGIAANGVDVYVWIIVYVCKRSLSAAKK